MEALCFVASDSPEAQQALERLRARYGSVDPDRAEVVVALGGDGLMLHTMHRFLLSGLPIYGMNQGTIGFLMNEYREDGLLERIAEAESTRLYPLRMAATTEEGGRVDALAINEVSLLRQSRQAAKLRIVIDGVERLPELMSDGVLLATPAGSTAYNLSAHGPIIPLGADLLALTPVSAFRPRRWRGALLPSRATVRIEVLERWKRPVIAVADNAEVRGVVDVEVREDRDVALDLLFDPHHNLDERVLREQFSS